MKYRLPSYEDIDILKEYVEEHYSNYERSISASNGMTNMNFKDWVDKINRNAEKADDEWGRYLLYLAFDDNDKLVGLLNIRYDLSEELREKYSDIGYGIRPSERRKGYATEMIRLALLECKKIGIDRVLMVCDKTNIGSAKSIIKNGGALENEFVDAEGKIQQRYWIELV